MKKCYHCKISFSHEGDPIDENDFCGHICSRKYINWVELQYHKNSNLSDGPHVARERCEIHINKLTPCSFCEESAADYAELMYDAILYG